MPRRRREPPAASSVALGGGLAVAAAVVVFEARRLYFFGDDWNFLLRRDLSGDGLLEPHNEHLSTLPLLVYRVMFHLVGIDHHLVYALGPVVLHVATCLLLFALLRRHDVRPWPAVISVLVLAFLSGNLGENPLWSFQIGFLGSAVCGLVALLVYGVRGETRSGLALVWAVTVLSMMCSGMAVPMALWLGAYVLVLSGMLRALTVLVAPVLVYLAWYLAYGRSDPVAPPAGINDLLEFVWTGVGQLWQEVIRLPATGGLVFLSLLAVTLLAPMLARTRALALSGVLTMVAMYLSIGISRAGLGPEAATASRYAYFGILFTLPAFAIAISLLGEHLAVRPFERGVAATVLVLALALNGVAQTVAFTDSRATLTDGLKGRILATERLVAEDQKFLNQMVSVPYHPDITVDSIARPEIRAALPDDPVSPRDLVEASAVLQVGAAVTSLQLPAATGFGRHDVTGDVAVGGCSTLQAGANAFLDLPPTETGTQVELTSRADTYPTQLVAGRLVSAAVVLTATPGIATFIGTTSTQGTLRVTLTPGRFQLCLR